MPKRYRQIPLSEATDGMILSDAVLDTHGNVLLPQGTTLSAAMLVSLARHEIATVAITGAPLSTEDDGAEHDREVERIERLFRQPGAIPALASAPATATATDILHQYILTFRTGATS